MTLTQGVAREIDITSEVCPMTFVRTRLALDRLLPGDLLLVHLKGHEPLENVPRSATSLGHEIVSLQTDSCGVNHLLIRRGPVQP